MWKILIIILLMPWVTNAAVNTGLVGYWPLDIRDNSWTGTASTSEDRSGNGNKVLFVSTLKTAQAKAQRNTGMSLNGISNIMRVAHNANYSFGTGDFTISYWVKRNELTGQGSSFDNIWAVTKWVSGTNANNEWYSGFGTTSTTNQPAFGIRSSGGTQYTIWGPNNTVINTWYHITDVREGQYMSIYIDGVLATSSMLLPAGTSVNAPATPNNLHFGYSTGSSLFTAAVFDDVRIYNRALSSSEIRELYKNGLSYNYWGKLKHI